jgi:hypothetical protein
LLPPSSSLPIGKSVSQQTDVTKAQQSSWTTLLNGICDFSPLYWIIMIQMHITVNVSLNLNDCLSLPGFIS